MTRSLARDTRCAQSVIWTSKCLIPVCKRQTGSWWTNACCWGIHCHRSPQTDSHELLHRVCGRQHTISIFSALMVCMTAWPPIQAVSAAFKMLGSLSQKFLQGLVYLIGNLMVLALGVCECQSTGLLLTPVPDWLAFSEPPEKIGFSGGGLLL